LYVKEKEKKTETDKKHLQVLSAHKVISHLRLTFSDNKRVGYNIIKVLVESITRGKNFKNLGMKDFKVVYTNEDVPWPKVKKEEADAEMNDDEDEEAGSQEPEEPKILSQ